MLRFEICRDCVPNLLELELLICKVQINSILWVVTNLQLYRALI